MIINIGSIALLIFFSINWKIVHRFLITSQVTSSIFRENIFRCSKNLSKSFRKV